MRVLITGGLGNLGAWLTDYLAQRNCSVTVLSRSRRGLLSDVPFTHIACDLTDMEACRRHLGDNDFDVVVHLASANDTHIDDYSHHALRVNALGTQNLLTVLSTRPSTRFVYLSTVHVYGELNGTITEASPARPRHDYALTHLFAEQYIEKFHRTHGLDYVILRLTNGYGCPKHKGSDKWYLVLNDLARMAYEKRTIRLNSNGKAQRDFIWHGDVCEILTQIIREAPGLTGCFNLSSEKSIELGELSLLVQTAYRESFGTIIPIETNTDDTSAHDGDLVVSSHKLRQCIPFTPRDRISSEVKAIFRLLQAA